MVKALSLLLPLALLSSIISLQVSPQLWWGIGLLASLAPLLWLLNLLLFVWFLLRPTRWMVAPAVTLLLGLSLVSDTVAFSLRHTAAPAGVGVLSYNLSHFGRPKNYVSAKDSLLLPDVWELKEFLHWISAQPAAIKCFQEYYTYPGDPFFDADAQLQEGGWTYTHLAVDTLQVNKSVYGLAIYSRYPIIASGMIFRGSTSFNKGIWADVVTDEGDTLRIINVHLESAQLQRTRYQSRGKKETLRNLGWVMRKSLQAQAQQAEQVLRFAQQSPYPVILAGDFNSTPYSWAYQQLDEHFQNAFTAKGSGFGFTFNHPKLFFLRIDHQFASSSLKVKAFHTRQDVPYSAHYPTEGWYSFPQPHRL